jgi:hypothetical protein
MCISVSANCQMTGNFAWRQLTLLCHRSQALYVEWVFSFHSHGKSKKLIDYLGKGQKICIKAPLSSLTVYILYSYQHPQLYLINPRGLLAIPNVITIISKRRLSLSSTLSTLSSNQPAVILLMLSISSQSSRLSPSATLSSSSLNLQGYHYLQCCCKLNRPSYYLL